MLENLREIAVTFIKPNYPELYCNKKKTAINRRGTLLKSHPQMKISSVEFLDFESLLESFIEQLQQGTKIPTVEQCQHTFPKFAREIAAHFPGLFIAEKLRRQNFSAQVDLELPQLIGNYLLTGKLGHGGMATVFNATQQHLEREFAVKLIDCSKCNQREVDRFSREAETLKSLLHPGIPTIFEFGQHENYMFIAMEKVEGITFEQLFSKPNTINTIEDGIKNIAEDWKLLAIIFREVAKTIAYIHEQNLVHRDIKPSNLMIDTESKIWITDLGLAINLTQNPPQIDGFDLAGTHPYLAPECYAGNLNFQSDIYSLGVTIFELATGVSAATLVKRLDKNRQELPNVKSVNNDIPKRLAAIIDRSCKLDRSDRYQNIKAVANSLEEFVMSLQHGPKR